MKICVRSFCEYGPRVTTLQCAKNFGEIEQTLSKNQKEITKSFDVLTENQEKTSLEIQNKIKETNDKIDTLTLQNEVIKKDLDFNKKLSFGIIVLVIISIIVS